MAIELPEKFNLGSLNPVDLKNESKSKYEQRRAEEDRRKDSTAEGVAKESLECYYEMISLGVSPSEAFTVYGYSLRVVKAALKEEKRILSELKLKSSSSEVSDGILDVKYVQDKYAVVDIEKPVK